MLQEDLRKLQGQLKEKEGQNLIESKVYKFTWIDNIDRWKV